MEAVLPFEVGEYLDHEMNLRRAFNLWDHHTVERPPGALDDQEEIIEAPGGSYGVDTDSPRRRRPRLFDECGDDPTTDKAA